MSIRKINFNVVSICLFVFVIAGQSLACPPWPPVAVLSAEPAYVDVDVNTILDGSNSYDLDGNIVHYEWDFEYDGSTFTVDYNEIAGNAPDGTFDGNTPHSYSSPGIYTAALRVTDNNGLTDIDTCTVYVRGTYYVDPNGSDDNDGLSWANAFATIQKGISSAVGGNPDDPNKYDVIDVNKGTYVTKPIWLHDNSNQKIIFEEGVTVRPHEDFDSGVMYWNNLFDLWKVNNITLEGKGAGPVFYSDMNDPNSKANRALSLRSCENIDINNITIEGSWWGGITLSLTESSSMHYCKDILIENVDCNDTCNSGIAVVSVDGLTIQNCVVRNTHYSDIGEPQSGINFEAGSGDDQRLANISISDCTMEYNAGRGININLNNIDSNSEDVGITIEDCNISGTSRFGLRMGFMVPDGGDGSIKFKDITVRDANCGLLVSDKLAGKVTVVLENCTWENIATPGEGTAPLQIKRDNWYGTLGNLGDIEFVNCQVFDDINRPAIEWYGKPSVDYNDVYGIHGDIHVSNPNRPGELYEWNDANLHNVDITLHRGLACSDLNDADPNWADLNDSQVWDFYVLDSDSNGYYISKKYIYADANLDANHCQTNTDTNIPHLHFESDFNDAEVAAANRFWDWYFNVDNDANIVRDSNASITRNGLAWAMDGYAGSANYDYWIVASETANKIFTDDCTKRNSTRPPTTADVNDRLVYEGYLDKYRLAAIVDSVDGNEPTKVQFKCGYSGIYSYTFADGDDCFAVPGRDNLTIPDGDDPNGTWEQDYWDSNDADVYY